MDVLLAVAAAGVVAWVAARLRRQRDAARLAAWRRAVAEAGLESVEETRRFAGLCLQGRSGALSLRLERFKRGKGPAGTRIEIAGLEHGPFGLSFRKEGLGTRLDRALTGERDIETGDPAFDREVFVSGQATVARSVLGAEARRAVRWLLNGSLPLPDGSSVDARVAVDHGRLVAEVTESVFDAPGRPPVSGALVRALLDAARLLASPPSPPRAVAALAANDPVPGVRLACLRHLVLEFQEDAATREALVRAQGDPSPPVRLEAALASGADGRETLVALARDAGVDDALRAQAIGALGDALPLAVAEETIARDRESPASALASIAALGGMGEPAVPLLARALESAVGGTAAAAARALGRTGAGSERILVAALGSERPAVRVAVAESLGLVGSVACVPVLRDAAARDDEAGMGRAVRHAVARIHERLSGAEPGQLSLAAAGPGELSLAGGDAGELSLAPGRAGSGADEAAAGGGPRRPQGPGIIQGKT